MLRGSARQWRRAGKGVDTHPKVVLLCWALKGFFFPFFFFLFPFLSPAANTMVGSNVVENLRRGYQRHDSFLLYFPYH